MAEFFIEIGCEEIPAKMIPHSLAEGRKILDKLLSDYAIKRSETRCYNSPTRLVYHIEQLDAGEPDQTVRMEGPPERVCLDENGEPTRALLGFMKKTGLPQDKIRFEPGKTGDIAIADVFVQGRKTADILATVLPELFKRIPFRKNMKWGDRDVRFVRPIRWICALLDGKPVDLSIADVEAGNTTRGHRIIGQRVIPVQSFDDYRTKLTENHVWIDPEQRKARIRDAIAAFESTFNATVIQDEELLEEVTHLVEVPLVVEGTFDAAFLDIPEEVLITSMKEHQKYFAARGADGNLLPRFLAIASMDGDPEGNIKIGNERVLAARLYDARFFWDEDRKKKLADRFEKLERQVFQTDLGSYADKIERMVAIGRKFAAALGADPGTVEQTIRLSKCDLATDMVYEFPELQGIMGGLYAQHENMPEPVWQGIYDHYRPSSMDDDLPRTPEGELTAIADKLDTFLGCLAVGIVPTGSKDPFGLRRAAQGIIRIVMEKGLDLDLFETVSSCMPLYESVRKLEEPQWKEHVFAILDARLAFWLQQQGFAYDEIEAATALDHGRLLDTLKRAEAVREARGNDAFMRVASSFKRIRNILASASDEIPEAVDHAAFVEETERKLADDVQSLAKTVHAAAGEKQYTEALQAIAGIADVVDRFFEDVLVMDKDDNIRRNRLALLASLKTVFETVADFSRLVIEGESVR